MELRLPGLELKKMPKKEEIEIRSDEVQEIMSHVPNWMILWGITLIFVLILMLVAISWFVKYPDVITGQIVLTTETPPVKIVSKSSGKLVKLFKKEGSRIAINDAIAEIESPVSEQGVEYLLRIIDDVNALVKKNISEVNFADSNYVFGAIQPAYNTLKKLCLDYEKINSDQFQQRQIEKLKQKIKHFKRLIQISESQVYIARKELKNAEYKYTADKLLYSKGVLSKMEFYRQETAFRDKQQGLEGLKKSVTQNEITQTDLEKELLNLEYETLEEERNLRENIQLKSAEIKSAIDGWQKSYLLSASITGKLSYMLILSQNQYVNSGDVLFAIVPEGEKYIGLVDIPVHGFGKIKIGQTVKIKFDNYPYYEYGQVTGSIKSIAQIPNKNGYRAEVVLTNGMITSYNKTLGFKPEMTGTAEVITEDLRLLQRIFNRFRKVLDK